MGACGGKIKEVDSNFLSTGRNLSANPIQARPLPLAQNDGGVCRTRPTPRIYIADYDFEAQTPDQTSFKKGEKFVIKAEDPDKLRSTWCLATRKSDMVTCSVPFDYLRPLESVEDQKWFAGGKISHAAAERMLLVDGNRLGFYMIRQRRTNNAQFPHVDYALTVMTQDSPPRIQHYLILQLNTGEYFLEKKYPFETLGELVQYYCVFSSSRPFDPTQGPQRPPRLTCPWVKVDPTVNGQEFQPITAEFEFPREKIETVKRKHTGRFCETYLGRWDGYDLALKVFPHEFVKSTFLEDARNLRDLNHARIISYLGVSPTGPNAHAPAIVLMQLSRDGTLQQYVRKKYGKDQPMPIKDVIDLADQICEGMAYLETKEIVHGDLAAKNIMMEKNNIKICDFGLFNLINDDMYAQSRTMLRWTAPEALTEGGQKLKFMLTTKSDVWAFAIVLTEIITRGSVPYSDKRRDADVLKFVRSGLVMKRPAECPEKLYNLLLDCWRYDPSTRPMFEVLKWDLEAYFQTEASNYGDFSADEPRTEVQR